MTIPDWVYVWAWARKRGETRSFPHQERSPLVVSVMTLEDYESIESAWRKAGSPKLKAIPIDGMDEAA